MWNSEAEQQEKGVAFQYGVVDSLIEKCKMFNQLKMKYYYFFSKSGFTHGAHELAKERDDIRLIGFINMFN